MLFIIVYYVVYILQVCIVLIIIFGTYHGLIVQLVITADSDSANPSSNLGETCTGNLLLTTLAILQYLYCFVEETQSIIFCGLHYSRPHYVLIFICMHCSRTKHDRSTRIQDDITFYRTKLSSSYGSELNTSLTFIVHEICNIILHFTAPIRLHYNSRWIPF